MLRHDGWSARKLTYDAHGRVVEETFLDAKGQVSAAPGHATRRQRYAPTGQLAQVQYLDAQGEPTLGPEGYASLRVEYDAAGQEVIRKFYDAKSQLGHPTEEFAVEQKVYNRFGRVRQIVTLCLIPPIWPGAVSARIAGRRGGTGPAGGSHPARVKRSAAGMGRAWSPGPGVGSGVVDGAGHSVLPRPVPG